MEKKGREGKGKKRGEDIRKVRREGVEKVRREGTQNAKKRADSREVRGGRLQPDRKTQTWMTSPYSCAQH